MELKVQRLKSVSLKVKVVIRKKEGGGGSVEGQK